MTFGVFRGPKLWADPAPVTGTDIALAEAAAARLSAPELAALGRVARSPANWPGVVEYADIARDRAAALHETPPAVHKDTLPLHEDVPTAGDVVAWARFSQALIAAQGISAQGLRYTYAPTQPARAPIYDWRNDRPYGI